MALTQTDMPLDQLRTWHPEIPEPEDFQEFWTTTLDENRSAHPVISLTPASTPIRGLIAEDLTFRGFAGDLIHAWVIRPRQETPLPTVIEFIGYGGGRGRPQDHLAWAAAGYTHIVMDTRGQGSVWGTGGDTADPHGTGPSTPGFMTRGVESPQTYYYRRVFTDAVCLVEAAQALPFVDADRIAVTGASQGGGVAIATAGLDPNVRAVMPDVPFLCHIERAISLTPEAPFTEVTRYLSIHRDRAENTLRTLSYFDGAHFATRIAQPCLFSVALMDEVVLPSTVFAAYNRLGTADHEIIVYPYNGHEGGLSWQWERQVAWLEARLGAA